MQEGFVIGVDIGGTKVATALCDYNGRIINKKKMYTYAVQGPEAVIRRITDTIRQVVDESGISIKDVSGIGIASPGPLNVSEGKIVYIASIGWNNVPLRDMFYKEFGIYTCIENDCNAAAYSESIMGAGKGYERVIYITVSTGIGSGIVINGDIYHGRHDAAGEFGHICIEYGGRDCTCGNKGCLQAYASGTAIAQIAKEKISKYKNTKILELANAEGMEIDGSIVEKAARMNDPLAVEIWRQTGQRLGQGISVLMQLFDPDVVVIGGGVTKAWDLFYDPMMDAVKNNTYKLFNEDIIILPAKLGEDVGVLGAALLAVKGIESKGMTAVL